MEEYIANLNNNMAEFFSLNDLRTLALELSINWDKLSGETIDGKAFALIVILAKAGRLADLITILRTERPNVQWENAPSPGQQINFGKPLNLEGSTAYNAFYKGVGIMGEIGDQVVDYAKHLETTGTQHRRIVEAREGLIVNRSHGQMQIITPEQFQEKLKTEDLEHINTLAKSMENLYQQWQENYPKRNSFSSSARNKKVQQKLDELVKEVAQDLGRIVRYLDRLGFMLDDHYQRYRDLADEFA